MKWLLLILLTGCSAFYPKHSTKIDRIESCVYRLIENNGVEPEKAEITCNRIFINRFQKRKL